jgi:type IV pilus assembly protein PilA
MTDRLRKRIGISEREGGFTLIELLVVLIIIAVLLAIAIPAYLGFKDRAEKRAAQSNVRIAIPSAEAYAEENDGTAGDSDGNAATTGYTGMTTALLQAIDPQVKVTVSGAAPTNTTYCIQNTTGSYTAWYNVDGNPATVDTVQVQKGGGGC